MVEYAFSVFFFENRKLILIIPYIGGVDFDQLGILLTDITFLFEQFGRDNVK